MHATMPFLKDSQIPTLVRRHLTTLQVNLGYRCNRPRLNCHVNPMSNRTEMMDANTLQRVVMGHPLTITESELARRIGNLRHFRNRRSGAL